METRYTVRQAVEMTGVKSYVLRYWEEELELRIHRNELGHRYYTGYDIQLFMNIKELKKRGLQLRAIRELIPKLARTAPGSTESRTKLLFDDMVDTAGSLCNAAKAIVEVGGARNVYACASHGVLSGPALERLEGSNITELALLNTIPETQGAGCSKIKYLSVAPMFGEAIERIYQEISIAKLFN